MAMDRFGVVLVLLGGFIALLAQLWVLIAAFKKDIVWGLVVLLLPFVSLIFIVVHFGEMKWPVLMYVIGLVMAMSGVGIIRPMSQRLREETAAQER